MMVSPFTFYRGAAKIMAADLKDTPTAGLNVQLCGDAHLSNFGVFASPERTLLFDVNDFDETLPGPFEYDVKRMAASFAIAARNNAFAKSDVRVATTASVRAYREAMTAFASADTMDIWYAHISADDVLQAMSQAAPELKGSERKRLEKNAQKTVEKAHTRDSLQALSKLAEHVDGQYRIVSQPPVVVPIRDLPRTAGMSSDEIEHMIHEQFRAYRATLQDDRRHLLERFQVIDVARKVVGVGSVGTQAFIVLLQGRDQQDPLFLQVKGATRSVLEDHLPKSRYRQPGERVVQGQRMMQAASDIFLGWTKGVDADRYLYWRQLRDMKGLRGHRDHGPGRPRRSTPASAAKPSPARTPDPETPSRSPPTSARKTSSTEQSPTSPNATPTKTNTTTRPSPKQSAPADSKHSKASNSNRLPPSCHPSVRAIVPSANSVVACAFRCANAEPRINAQFARPIIPDTPVTERRVRVALSAR